MNLISLLFMIVLTSLSGTLSFLLWKLLALALDKKGSIQGIRLSLYLTVVFFALPVSFFGLAWRTGLFSDGMSGNLFQRTPFIKRGSVVLFFLWLAGFVLSCIKYGRKSRANRRMLRRAKPAAAEICETAENLRRKLRIRRRIPVYQVPVSISPYIAGLIRCRIVIPEKEYEAPELQMILEHELWHYKQGDLLFQAISGLVLRFQWFNPLVRLLSGELERWGDAGCDLRLCGQERPWSLKEYFRAVFLNVRSDRRTPAGMGLGRLEEAKERIERMKKYNSKKELKRFWLALLALCFFTASAATAMAAGGAVGAAYGRVYEATEVTVEEPMKKAEALEEYEWNFEESGYSAINTGEGQDENVRTYKTFNWQIPANNIVRSGNFFFTKGEQVTMSIIPNPLSAKTGIGLDQPNGVLRGVSSTGTYGHTFTINQSGTHKIYARNETGSPIEVSVTIMYN